MPSANFAPNTLYKCLIKETLLAAVRGDTETVAGVTKVLSTHYGAGTILGDMLRVQQSVDGVLSESLDRNLSERALDRARSRATKAGEGSIRRAYSAALSESRKFIAEASTAFSEPNEWDQLVESWLGCDVATSVRLEESFLAPKAPEVDQMYDEVKSVDSSMLGVVHSRAAELLEGLVSSEFSDDSRQAELLRVWSNSVDGEDFRVLAMKYVKEANSTLARFLTSSDNTIAAELAKESKNICENLLYGQPNWDDVETLRTTMLVLESERAIRERI